MRGLTRDSFRSRKRLVVRNSRTFQRLRLASWACFLLVACCPIAVAQTSAPFGSATAKSRAEPYFALGSQADRLSVFVGGTDQTLLFERDRFREFGPPILLARPFAIAAAAGASNYVWDSDGYIQSRREGAASDWEAELSLPPGRRLPIAICGAPDGLYALIGAKSALAIESAAQSRPTPAVVTPEQLGSADRIFVARYADRRWEVVGICPDGVDVAGHAPQIVIAPDGWLLIVRGRAEGDDRQFSVLWRPHATGEWRTGFTFGQRGLEFFAGAILEGRPAFLAAARGADQTYSLKVLRVHQSPEGNEALMQRPTQFDFSALPDDAKAARPVALAAFNRHLVLLRTTPEQSGFVQFGAPGGTLLERTYDVRALVQRVNSQTRIRGIVQFVMAVVLAGIVTGLVVFRYNSVAGRESVPEGVALASPLRRLLAGLIDFAPFAIAWSIFTDVRINQSLTDVVAWSYAPQPDLDSAAIVWWLATCGSFAFYCGLMELLTGRTVGKMLLAIRIRHESAAPAKPLQVLIRNALRLIELLPPFWLIALLVVLSPRRQRLGDIFARTIVTQPPPAVEADDEEEEDATDGEDSEPRT